MTHIDDSVVNLFRDRTEEFRGAVKIFREQGVNVTPKRVHNTDSMHDFANSVARVTQGFSSVEKLITRLVSLVNLKGLFNDPTEEINEVTTLFKTDLKSLSEDVLTLQRFAGGHLPGSPQMHTQRQLHCQTVAEALRQKLGSHTKKFQEALSVRTGVLKEQSSRRSRFSHNRSRPRVQLDSPLFAKPRQPEHPATIGPEVKSSAGEGGVDGGAAMETGKTSPILPTSSFPHATNSNRYGPMTGAGPDDGLRRRGGTAPTVGSASAGPSGGSRGYGAGPFGIPLAKGTVNPSNSINEPFRPGGTMGGSMAYSYAPAVSERREAVHQVESAVVELGTMFSRMATMVAEQGEVVNRIDDDTEISHMHVKQGQSELEKYFRNLQGDRALILKLFAVLIFFIVLFVVVF